MLKKETIKQIATLLKLKEADLEAAIKAETETEVTIDAKLQAFDETELQTLKSNSYKEGKKAGVEMEVDEIKKELGYDFQGKTVKGLVEFNKKKVLEDAKIEPEQKVKDLTEKLSNIQKNYTDLEGKLAEKDKEVSSVKIKTEVFKYIPAFGEESGFDQEDVYNKMQREGYDFRIEDGKTVAYKNGTKVLDKVSNPLELKDVINTYVVEKKIVTPETIPAGRGGGNGKANSTFGTLTELKKQFTDQNKSLLGAEFSEALDKAVKANPEFALDK
jgi:hypothetical protein